MKAALQFMNAGGILVNDLSAHVSGVNTFVVIVCYQNPSGGHCGRNYQVQTKEIKHLNQCQPWTTAGQYGNFVALTMSPRTCKDLSKLRYILCTGEPGKP